MNHIISPLFQSSLVLKRILVAVQLSCRLVICNVGYSEIAEYRKKRFSCMTERYCAVMRIVFRNQNVAVEASHFRNGKHADSAE